jgi:hypothetical protein
VSKGYVVKGFSFSLKVANLARDFKSLLEQVEV